MPGSALNDFIVLLVKIFQAKKKILTIGPLEAEISFMQKSNDKSLSKIGLSADSCLAALIVIVLKAECTFVNKVCLTFPCCPIKE